MKREYSNGYWDKIQYHQTRLQTAIENKDKIGMLKALNSLTYFLDKQGELDSKTN
jgi:hypothetical protein